MWELTPCIFLGDRAIAWLDKYLIEARPQGHKMR